ncbi:DUF7521 family protein [Halosimplex amylolyticum]|uniref:DUF7521 family protein n=1 Tax=Halosimplex amylolyticum TaxID=3396616 RepID=UPI003F558679
MSALASIPLVAAAVVVDAVAAAAGEAVPPVLQLDQFDSTAEVLLQTAEFFGALLGLYVAYQAYRGYRRNDSRPMLFIAVGFAVIMGVPALLFVPVLFVPGLPLLGVQSVIQAFEIVGLLCIIYALRMEP